MRRYLVTVRVTRLTTHDVIDTVRVEYESTADALPAEGSFVASKSDPATIGLFVGMEFTLEFSL